MAKKESKPVEKPGPGDETDFGVQVPKRIREMLDNMPKDMAKDKGRKIGMQSMAMMPRKKKD